MLARVGVSAVDADLKNTRQHRQALCSVKKKDLTCNEGTAVAVFILTWSDLVRATRMI